MRWDVRDGLFPTVYAMLYVPGVVPPTAHTWHEWLALTQCPEISLAVTGTEKLALERDHPGDRTTRLLSHGP